MTGTEPPQEQSDDPPCDRCGDRCCGCYTAEADEIERLTAERDALRMPRDLAHRIDTCLHPDARWLNEPAKREALQKLRDDFWEWFTANNPLPEPPQEKSK